MNSFRLVVVVSVFFTAAVAVAATVTVSPYAGQEQRAIKSLSAQDVADLLAGKGMGFAKAAELNGYPGPSHVLELAEPLRLTPDQRTRTENLFKEMQRKAVAAGKELVDEERALNDLFSSKAVTASALKEAVDRVAARQARVRLVHLETHLAQMEILSPEQVATYNTLRGYNAGAAHGHRHAH
jgi:Spy/CpxP family protein refolding chaperone